MANGQRRSDSILGTFYRDSLRAQKFALMVSLFVHTRNIYPGKLWKRIKINPYSSATFRCIPEKYQSKELIWIKTYTEKKVDKVLRSEIFVLISVNVNIFYPGKFTANVDEFQYVSQFFTCKLCDSDRF